MGKLRPGHFIEVGLWLALAAILYVYSFEFEQSIEIYKFGATGWPRAIILLIVVAALGQLFYHWLDGDEPTSGTLGAASDDGSEDAARESGHTSFAWYVSTFVLLAIPFLYMRIPAWMEQAFSLDATGLHTTKLIFAGLLFVVYVGLMWRNYVGGMLALPIFFAALLEDLGFYAMAPLFIIGVMFLMGERRVHWMALIAALIMGVMLFLFVSLLYVGLPTGTVHPFYDFSHWLVARIQ